MRGLKKRKKRIRISTRSTKRTCEYCGRIVLAERYDAHIEALCTIKCQCGLVVRGRFFKEHQNTPVHRKHIVEKRADRETFSTLVKEGKIKPVKLPWKPLPPGSIRSRILWSIIEGFNKGILTSNMKQRD